MSNVADRCLAITIVVAGLDVEYEGCGTHALRSTLRMDGPACLDAFRAFALALFHDGANKSDIDRWMDEAAATYLEAIKNG